MSRGPFHHHEDVKQGGVLIPFGYCSHYMADKSGGGNQIDMSPQSATILQLFTSKN